jgi:hypothetical protein
VKLAFDENPLSVYGGQVTLRVALAAAKDAANGTHLLAGSVRFQSCNDEVCLPPASVPFTLEVTVTGGSAPGAGPPPRMETTPPDSAGAVTADTAASSMQAEPGAPGGEGGGQGHRDQGDEVAAAGAGLGHGISPSWAALG